MDSLTKSMALALIPALVFFAATANADDLRYRVAGIVEAESRSLAMIESSDGKQSVYRAGDEIGSGEIGSISGDGVIVLLNGNSYLLPLQGEPTVLRDLELAKAGYHMKISDGVGQYKIDFSAARQALLDANRPPDEREEDNFEYKYDRISAALSLPDGARVIAVDEMEMDTAELTIVSLVSSMNHDLLRVRVSGIPGVRRIYISGEPDL